MVGELNLISVAFAVLFIGFGVDFGIHFCMRAKEYIDADIAPGLALEEAAIGVAPGLTLTTLAASIGFLSFVPTDYRGLVELGVISSFGMFVALATSLSIVPAYLSLRHAAKVRRSAAARDQQRGFGTHSKQPGTADPLGRAGARRARGDGPAVRPLRRFSRSTCAIRSRNRWRRSSI